MLDFMDKKTQSILKEHGFDAQGVPEMNSAVAPKLVKPAYLNKPTIQSALTEVVANMNRKGFAAEDIAQVQKAASSKAVYEQAEKSVGCGSFRSRKNR